MSGIRLVVDNTGALGTAAEAGTEHLEITKAVVERLARLPRIGRDIYVQDTELPGFRLRRTPKGTVLFLFLGRIRGGEGSNKSRTVKRTIGPATGAGAISTARARAVAMGLREQLAKGIDPADELRAKADAAEAVRAADEKRREVGKWTPEYALEQMLEWRESQKDPGMRLRPETVEYYRRGIRDLKKLARVPVVDLGANAIRDALGELDGAAKPAKAKRALSGVIAFAIKRLELNIPNPVSRLERGEFKSPAPRESYIRESDIGGFVANVLSLRYLDVNGAEIKERESRRARDYILLTLLYGCRKEELMQMRWSWFDWEEGSFTIPASVTKQKKPHRLPLTQWTKKILKSRYVSRKSEIDWVFPGDAKNRPLRDVRGALDRVAGPEFKLHDLRRTLVTHCQALSIPMVRIKAIVGHSAANVTETYDAREVEQVRRDLTTYHEWVKDQYELATRYKNQIAAIEAEQEKEAEKSQADWLD